MKFRYRGINLALLEKYPSKRIVGFGATLGYAYKFLKGRTRARQITILESRQTLRVKRVRLGMLLLCRGLRYGDSTNEKWTTKKGK